MHHQRYEYQGRISKLSRLLEHDIPQANAALLHILRQLEAYQLEHPPTAAQTPIESKMAESKPVVTKRTNTHSDHSEDGNQPPNPTP
jgi:hypothetical protein